MSARFITEKRRIDAGDHAVEALLLRPCVPPVRPVTRALLQATALSVAGGVGESASDALTRAADAPFAADAPRPLVPGVLWIHGGGYSMGMPSMVYASRALPLVEKYGAVVLSPRYRLSGEAPYPAGFDDCYAALRYLRDHVAELGVDPRQIMVGGESAGGGMAVALCLAARDRGDVAIAYQMPLYPMLDDRDTPSSRDNHEFIWNTFLNHRSWRAYLAGLSVDGRSVAGNPEADVPPTAAPARERDFRGLPPCYTFVGNREPFYCETLAYVAHLRAAGVEVACDVYDSGMHAFDMLTPWRRISRVAAEHFEQHYLYAVAHYATDD